MNQPFLDAASVYSILNTRSSIQIATNSFPYAI